MMIGDWLAFATAINKAKVEIYEDNVAKGFWEKPRTPLEIYALVHSEISEAVEDVRTGNEKPLYFEEDGNGQMKPCGELSEIADAIIRLLDYCGHKGWDIGGTIVKKLEYNRTRPYKHGKKL